MTFPNHCELHRTACLEGKKISIKHDGRCKGVYNTISLLFRRGAKLWSLGRTKFFWGCEIFHSAISLGRNLNNSHKYFFCGLISLGTFLGVFKTNLNIHNTAQLSFNQ